MKKIIAVLSIWVAVGAAPALAANVNIDGLPAAASVGGTDLLECEQSGTNRKCTAAQTAAYIYGLTSGDATVSGVGAVTFATVNANVGSFGSTTSCPTVTVNGKGLITAASAANCAPAIGSVTGIGTGGITALGINVGTAGAFVVNGGALGIPASATLTNASGLPTTGLTGRVTLAQIPQGIANSIWINPTAGTADMQNIAVPACANDGIHALVYINGTGLQCAALTTGGAGTVTTITPGAGQVSSVTAACSQSNITTTGTLSSAECVNAQVGTSYAIVDGDRAKLITGTNAASQAYTIAQAGAASAFQSGWFTRVQNKGAGALTITPTTSTICGNASLTIFPGQTQKITSDGANYQCDGGTTGTMTVAVQSGTNYPFVNSDFGTVVYLNGASNQIPTLPQAGTAGFPNGWYVQACNINAGSQTITPATSTIGGGASYVLRAGTSGNPVCVGIISDGTNYRIVPEGPALGNNVATALATTLSAAGGLTSTIASGTAALGTSAIGSAACATVVTVAATNTATTDVVSASFNGDPTAVTGYVPLTTGMLAIIGYPTAGNVNFKVCNNTSASITPGAITLNWKVLR